MPQGAWNLRVLNSTTFDKTGPTPYPKNEKDWPGVGIIRVFDFMTQNRQYFGPQRQANQGAVVFAGDSNIGEWKTLKDDFAPLGVANVGYRWRCHPRPFCSA
jgi:hypothetical protein